MTNKAWLNSLHEEGTREEIFEWLVKVDKENDTLLRQRHLVKELFKFLDYTEESDEGRLFHPVSISCCRALMTEPLGKVLKELKASIVPEA